MFNWFPSVPSDEFQKTQLLKEKSAIRGKISDGNESWNLSKKERAV